MDEGREGVLGLDLDFGLVLPPLWPSQLDWNGLE